MEVIDDRHQRASTILATQIPIERWHHTIGDPVSGPIRSTRTAGAPLATPKPRDLFDFATLKRRCRRILLLARVGTEHPAVGFSQPRGQADRGPGEGVTSEPVSGTQILC
jgi:hypothetical protein